MEILYILLVLLLVTRTLGEFAVRLGQPALVGELISGILLGTAVARYSESFPILAELTDNRVFVALTDLGVFFLMLYGGMELRPQQLAKASGSAFVVALSGLLLPLACGFGLGMWWLPDSPYRIAQSLFIGTALSITAVPVAIRVLMDLGKLDSKVGQIMVSAAIFDDVLSLVLLAALTAVAQTGELPELQGLLIVGGKIVFFFAITFVIGHYLFPRIGKTLSRFQAGEFELSAMLVVALGFALLAEQLHLHFILGAFMAGLFFGRQAVGTETFEDVETKISGITSGFLAPVVSACIWLHLQLAAIWGTPVFLVVLVAVAFLTKLAGAGLPALWSGLDRRQSLAVGVGMSARGAVELIIADIALRAGLFGHPDPVPVIVKNLFSSVVIVAVVTTVSVPIVLRYLFRSKTSEGS